METDSGQIVGEEERKEKKKSLCLLFLPWAHVSVATKDRCGYARFETVKREGIPMTVVAMYRCRKCGKEYRPLEAGARHDLCCGMRLERIPAQCPRWPSFILLRPNAPPADSSFRDHQAVSSQPPQPSASLGEPPSSIPLSQMAVEVSPNERQLWPVPDARRASSSNLGTSAIGDRVAGHGVMEIVPPREHRVDEAAAELLFASLGSSRLVSVEIGAEAGRIKFLLRGSEQAVSRAQHQVQAAYDQARLRPVPAEEDPARPDGTPSATTKLHLQAVLSAAPHLRQRRL